MSKVKILYNTACMWWYVCVHFHMQELKEQNQVSYQHSTLMILYTACTCECKCALPYTLTWFLLEELLCPKSQDTIELSLSVREHWRTPCQVLPPGGSPSYFSWLPQWSSSLPILVWQTGAANRTCEVPTLKLLYHCACACVDFPVPILQNIIVMMVPYIILYSTGTCWSS